MTRRARALFPVWLAFGLLQLLSLPAAGLAEARAHSARTWMPLQQQWQSTVHGTRAGLMEPDADHMSSTPFAAAESSTLGSPIRGSSPVVSPPPAIGAAASGDLSLARAPPTPS